MPSQLQITLGQYSDKGRKETNQDFHGACTPKEAQLGSKGVAIALADGISTSSVGHDASEAAVKTFLEDYYCTSDAWSVKQSALRVLAAANSWLYSLTQQSQFKYETDRGYVCTFSALILKSKTAHIVHVGDARIYRVVGKSLEQLTVDHRIRMGEDVSHLSRALGVQPEIDIDYSNSMLEVGEIFVLATDGVYEHINPARLVGLIEQYGNDLDAAAKAIVACAVANGSTDNLTIQIVRVDALPEADIGEAYRAMTALPFPPLLEARMQFDGYKIVREIHATSRSHLYLAIDEETQATVVIKTPSIDQREDPAYLERFLMEDWIARRIDSPHVAKAAALNRKRNFLYNVSEFIDGQTLAQWMIDNPSPSLETVRGILEQIAKGLRAFHRLEMLHQDLRPANVMVDRTGTVKLIDFGSTRVAGIAEISNPIEHNLVLGTAQYTAPEYFVGEEGTTRSDLFSLGVIAYQLLSGKLPYGTEVARIRNKTEQRSLRYRSLLDENSRIPPWIDGALMKAVHPDPFKRYEELSEFTHDLRRPNPEYLSRTRPALLERNPIAFWKGLSLILAAILVVLLVRLGMK